MNKTNYVVVVTTEKDSVIEDVSNALKMIGKLHPMIETAHELVGTFVPDDDKNKAGDITHTISTTAKSPFATKVFVSEVNQFNTRNTYDIQIGYQAKDDEDFEVPRNYNRFKTRKEAVAAYERENPHWVFPYGGGGIVKMSVEEWMWLPIVANGIYEKGKYEKFL